MNLCNQCPAIQAIFIDFMLFPSSSFLLIRIKQVQDFHSKIFHSSKLIICILLTFYKFSEVLGMNFNPVRTETFNMKVFLDPLNNHVKRYTVFIKLV